MRVIASSILFCSCADLYVTRTEVATPGGRTPPAAIDAKDYGSKGVHMITNCRVGASGPSAIYIRPFCIDTAVFKGDEALSDGEMAIRKAITPVEFANDLKEHGRRQSFPRQTWNGPGQRARSGDTLRSRERGGAHLSGFKRESVSLRRARQRQSA
jgi:hypothetical protein